MSTRRNPGTALEGIVKDREITPNVLDRLIAVAEENITKTRARTPRIWFDRSDRIREMQQTTQALQEFRLVMQERDEARARVAELEADIEDAYKGCTDTRTLAVLRRALNHE